MSPVALNLSSPLAALIVADEGEAADAAVLKIGGTTLLERLARQLRDAGAVHIVLAVATLPSLLVRAIDRLAGEGIVIEVARSPADAADAIHPDERLIVINGAPVIAETLLGRLAATDHATVLSVSKIHSLPHDELISSDKFWTGLAIAKGSILRVTAGDLGDWSLASTLLRQILQAGAELTSIASGEEPPEALWRPTDQAKANEVAGMLTKKAGGSRSVISAVAPMVAAVQIPASFVEFAGISLLLIGVVAGVLGWVATAFLVLAVARPIAAFAQSIAALAARRLGLTDRMPDASLVALAIILAAAAWHVYVKIGDQATVIMIIWLLTQMMLVRLSRSSVTATWHWIAGSAPLALVLACGWAFQQPVWGLAAAIATCLAVVISRLWRQPAA